MDQKTYSPFEMSSSWQKVLAEELAQPYLIELAAFVERERTQGLPVYPPRELVFNAFQKTAFEEVKVLIMGQDPYHGPGQAHGLSFSVPKGIPLPPSLQNIFKELVSDVGIPFPPHGCLLSWAMQGVMLLNATLTVRQGEPMSHHGKGWERFTDSVITKLAQRKEPVIFVLWGKSAQEKCRHIANIKEKSPPVFKAAHPSPLSAYNGFMGCRHFSQINSLLIQQGKQPIEWNLV